MANNPFGFLSNAFSFAQQIGSNLGGMLVSPERVQPNTVAVATTVPTTFNPVNYTIKSPAPFTPGPQNFINTAYQAVQGLLNPGGAAAAVGYSQGYSAGGQVAAGATQNVAKQVSSNMVSSIPDILGNISKGLVSSVDSIRAAGQALGLKMKTSVQDASTGNRVQSSAATGLLEIPSDLFAALLSPRLTAATSGFTDGAGAYQSYSPSYPTVEQTAGSPAGGFQLPGISSTWVILLVAVMFGFILLRRSAPA